MTSFMDLYLFGVEEETFYMFQTKQLEILLNGNSGFFSLHCYWNFSLLSIVHKLT